MPVLVLESLRPPWIAVGIHLQLDKSVDVWDEVPCFDGLGLELCYLVFLNFVDSEYAEPRSTVPVTLSTTHGL